MQRKSQTQQKSQKNNMSYAIDLIKKYEGLSLKAYLCPAHKWTIGYGCTVYPDGTPVKAGDVVTKEKAEALLLDYVINKIIPNIRDLALTENQQTAVISLIYNIGWGAFSKSKCYKAIKDKDWGTAYKNWDWITANGKVLNGLIKRREEERYLFFMDI
jgi:lysozyme